jgi:hypothetical protein
MGPPLARSVRAELVATATAILIAIVVARPPGVAGQPPVETAATEALARQVTLFGVLASPDDLWTDPQLVRVAPQLRKLLPKHGFRLLDVQTRRLTAGQTLACKLDDGFVAETTLIDPSDANGKVQLRCVLLRDRTPRLDTKVITPTNQLFFCDERRHDGSRLLIGIGAR